MARRGGLPGSGRVHPNSSLAEHMMTTTIPRTMTAIEIATPGGPEVLRPAEREVPKPGPGEVLIKVAGAGLNGADLSQRASGAIPCLPA